MVTAAERRNSYRDGNSTADRALAILQMFTESRSQVSASEVAGHLGVSRSTAYRYAQTLVRTDFLAEEPGKGFRLGARVMELARIARRGYGLTDMAVPVMRELAAQFHQTVLLTKRVGTTIVCLEREEWPGQYVRLSYERGSRLSLNAGASAWVLLAWLPETYVRDLLERETLNGYTDATLTEVDDIVERLERIRADGYCIAHGEVDRDVMGVAAPIFDAAGDVCGGLSIVTLRSRMDDVEVQKVVDTLLKKCADLGRDIARHSD